jgi:hypothetical protein
MITSNGVDLPDDRPKNISELKEMVQRFSLHAIVSDCGTVTVEDGVGNAQYLAKGTAESLWLIRMSTEIERRGILTLYHFDF